jgi:hypothetical protein
MPPKVKQNEAWAKAKAKLDAASSFQLRGTIVIHNNCMQPLRLLLGTETHADTAHWTLQHGEVEAFTRMTNMSDFFLAWPEHGFGRVQFSVSGVRWASVH